MNSQSRTPGATGSENQNAGRKGASLNASPAVYHKTHWIYNPRTGRPVGALKTEGDIVVFERRVIEAIHRLRLDGGSWAIEIRLFDHLQSLSADWVRLVTDRGRTLCAPLSSFHRHGRPVNFGHGPQIMLAEKFFVDRIHPTAESLCLPGTEEAVA